jgi:hypothetical protein
MPEKRKKYPYHRPNLTKPKYEHPFDQVRLNPGYLNP